MWRGEAQGLGNGPQCLLQMIRDKEMAEMGSFVGIRRIPCMFGFLLEISAQRLFPELTELQTRKVLISPGG